VRSAKEKGVEEAWASNEINLGFVEVVVVALTVAPYTQTISRSLRVRIVTHISPDTEILKAIREREERFEKRVVPISRELI
jgi:hypothetical protein